MYYELKAEDTVRVPPSMLVMKLNDAITKILREKYERRIFKELGMIIAVEYVDVGEQGTVIPGDGGIYYKVQFNAISFLPHVNEVYAAQVREIVEFGAFASIGPLDGLIHISQIGNEKFFYDKKTRALSTKRGRSLKKGDDVLLKVSTVSLKGTTSDTKIGLTMRSDGLGVMRWDKEQKAEKSAAKKAKKEAKR
ncbi:MAG: DNA-directed RNA polymerase [bacterium]|nr:DNA-directed RNA polymerase [bacterium]